MERQEVETERQRALIAQITAQTVVGTLRWERQQRSAHRYARWENHMLILGPTTALEDHTIPRYFFLTPLDSPTTTEVTTEDPELRSILLALIYTVEAATENQTPRDPFALSKGALSDPS